MSYLQTSAAECGLACVGFVACHFGQSFSMAELRAQFTLSMRGATLNDVARMSAMLGMSSRPLRLELDELPRLQLPCIIHWNLNHFVVLTDVRRNRITVHDPACGERRLPPSEFSRHFTGVALELTPAPEFQKFKPRPPIGWRQVIGPVTGLKRSLTQLFAVAASLQIIALIAPLFSQWIIDGAIVSADYDLLITLMIGALLVCVIRILMEVGRSWMAIVMSMQFGLAWSGRIKSHLIRLESKWFEARDVGDIVSRFQSMQSIQQTVTGRFVEILLDGLFSIIVLFAMLLYSLKLTLIVVVSLVLYALIRVLPHGRFHRANDEVLTHDAKAQTIFLENVRAIQAIKLGQLEEQRCAKWKNTVVLAMNRRLSVQAMSLAFSSGYNAVFSIEGIFVLSLGAMMAMDGSFTIGMLTAFMAYRGEFSSRMQRFVDNVMAVRMMRLHVERLADIVLADREIANGISPYSVDVLQERCDISLKDVSFRYADNGPWVLRRFSIDIRPGEHVAIVGPTGCGKTTLAKILLGLLQPTEGSMAVGGMPLMQYGLCNWRRSLGAVMQDDQLLSASILENVASFEPEPDLARARIAAINAGIYDEIQSMPMGFNTLIGDLGSTLSGGQKQRLLLARALYRKPHVLIMDEATSHLDVSREREVNQLIKSLAITRITIAHRPETIAMADRVVNLSSLVLRDSSADACFVSGVALRE